MDDYIIGEDIAPNPQAMVLTCLLEGNANLLMNAGINGTSMSEPYRSIWFWILSYVSDYDAWPHRNRVRERFTDVLLPEWDERPVDDVIDNYLSDLQQRQLRAAVIEVAKALESGNDALEKWVGWNEKIATGQSKVNIQSWKETFDERSDAYEKAVIANENGEEFETGIKTGIAHVDKHTLGMCPGELWLVLGRYDTGKTTLMTSIMLAAAHANTKCLVISPEHSNISMMRKVDALFFEADPVAMRRGTLGREFVEELREHKQRISQIGGDIIVVTGKKFTVDGIAALVKTLKPDALYLDGLTHLAPYGTKQQDWLKTGEVANQVSDLTNNLQIPVMAVVQQSKSSSGTPKDQIARSDMIGHYADVMLHIEAISDTVYALDIVKYRETMNRGGRCFIEKGKDGLRLTEISDPSIIDTVTDWNF